MPMTWTNDLPTKVGFYHFRRSPADSLRMMVEVVQPLPKSGLLLVYWCGSEGYEFISMPKMRQRYPSCQWSDAPIPEPEEPKQ